MFYTEREKRDQFLFKKISRAIKKVIIRKTFKNFNNNYKYEKCGILKMYY